MTPPTVADAPPVSDHLTGYDRLHLKTYARLLDAAADDADWQEAARIVLGLDVRGDRDRARRVYDAHLSRARWMSQTGYRTFLN